MKRKHIYVSICAMAMSVMLNVTAFAAIPSENSSMVRPNNANIEANKNRPIKHELTEEQKSEMKAKREALKAKWDSLSKEQKEEIYELKDKSFDAETKIIDKYLEFGVIDKGTATLMKTKISEHKSYMRKSGKMPGFGGKCKYSDKK